MKDDFKQQNEHNQEHRVEITYNGVETKIPAGEYTTEALLDILHVEQGYALNLIEPDGAIVMLEPGASIRIRKHMKFISQVKCGASS